VRRSIALGVAVIALLAVGGYAGWRALQPAHRPNVLVVLWDTTRADHLPMYGYDRPTTPNLAKFAEGGTVFERASSPGIWTLPSHASLFTGLPPESHGADERWMWLDDRFVTLAEHFGANGYATFAMAANSLLCEETNLVQGFDVKWTSYSAKFSKAAKAATHRKIQPNDASNELAPNWQPPAHGAHNAEWARAVYKEAAPIVTRSLLEWLDRRKEPEKPFFAFLNLMEAHTPRVPSMEARRRVLGDDPDLIDLGLRTDAAHINLHFYNFGKHDYTDRELAAIRGVYDATLVDLDDATGALFDGLAARGVLDDTIVVFTSDHGENLGDHHLFNHRYALWDSLVHVPLIVAGPGVPAGRVARPVDTIDLFATVSRLAGLPAPDGISRDDWFGDGAAPAVTHLAMPLIREIQTVKNVHPDVEIGPWMRAGHAVVDAGQKLITLSDGTRSLYDLAADPGELHPVDDPARAEALQRTVDAWLAGWPKYDPADRGPRDDPKHVRATQEDLRAELEALGYLTAEPEEPTNEVPTKDRDPAAPQTGPGSAEGAGGAPGAP
jgi:arylsulfatase A-like enzyme